MLAKRENGHLIELYDSIEELPIKRFYLYNKYLLLDSGIGSDLRDVTSHVEKAIRYINGDDKVNAIIELNNLYQNMHMINETINPKHMAFAALVYKIDGKEVTDLTDDGMKKVMETLQKARKTFIDCMLDAVKKKMDTELLVFFPEKFEDSRVKEYFDLLKERTKYVLNGLLTGEMNEKGIEDVELSMLQMFKPKMFFGKENAEVYYTKQYEDMCLILQSKLQIVDPHSMSVLQYYNAFDYIKKNILPSNGNAAR